MHDAITGERAGLPAVGIMTTQFDSAAQLMARVLGADGYPFVLIDHPISSAAPSALIARARKAATDTSTLLTQR